MAASLLGVGLSVPAIVPAFASSTHSSSLKQARVAQQLEKRLARQHRTSQPSAASASASATATRSLLATPAASATAAATPTATALKPPTTSAASTSTSWPTPSPLEPPLTTSAGLTDDQLVDSIGVNVHANYTDTTYVQNGTADVTLQSLVRLGVKRVRLGLERSPRGYIGPFLDGLRANGIKADAVAGTPTGLWGTYGAGQSAQLRDALVNGIYKNRIAQLELPNEWDQVGGSNWVDALKTFDAEYYRTLSGSGTGLPVIGPSMARQTAYSKLEANSAADAVNIHPYSGDQMPESKYVLPLWTDAVGGTTANRPVIATEFGWQNATNASRGVPEATSAAYLVRSLIWNRTRGVTQNYIYELFDEKPEPGLSNPEQHFGLVAVTGDPGSRSTWQQREKPAYTQLKNLLQRLQDNGTGTPAKVQYSVVGAPSDVTSTPLLRADGSMDIAIWRKIPLDGQQYTGRTSVTVKLGSPQAVSAYDSVTGRTSMLSASTTSVPVDVSGAVTILRVSDPR